MLHDVFICHASEDKDDFVRPLAERLRAFHLDVWYDEFTLTIGASLREAIDRGLAHSRFGIVVLSANFFRKSWPQRELNGLVARQTAEHHDIILPIWHGIGRDEILRYSPTLADTFAVPSELGLDAVVEALLRKLRPEESPLVVARDFLIKMGFDPPVVTDEWWLRIVEAKESQFHFPNETCQWIFPLPFRGLEGAKERGLNIAWTALQLEWIEEAEDQDLCQLTHPEVVHRFLRKWSGLLECGRQNPAVLAMYAPQLTIPGYDDGLSDVFDALLDPSREDAYQMPGYSNGPETTDGRPPLCGELIAWRHKTFGNYAPSELAYSFVRAHDGDYSRASHSAFDCLIWLLTDAANWMPGRLRNTLLEGMRKRDHWVVDLMQNSGRGAFTEALLRRSRSRFKFTRSVRSALTDLVGEALGRLKIDEAPATLAARFLAGDFVAGYYDWRTEIARMRQR